MQYADSLGTNSSWGQSWREVEERVGVWCGSARRVSRQVGLGCSSSPSGSAIIRVGELAVQCAVLGHLINPAWVELGQTVSARSRWEGPGPRAKTYGLRMEWTSSYTWNVLFFESKF